MDFRVCIYGMNWNKSICYYTIGSSVLDQVVLPTFGHVDIFVPTSRGSSLHTNA